MATKKKSLAKEIAEEGVTKTPKRKRTRKPPEKKAEPKLTKEEAVKKVTEEVVKEAEAIVEQRQAEFPDITLPTRGYFKAGDRGANVEALQTALNNLLDANIPIDGKCDAETLAAVKQFEREYGGFENGMFGLTELKAYNELRG